MGVVHVAYIILVIHRRCLSMSPVLNVRLPDDIARRLETLSAKTKRPKSFYVKQMLEEHLADYEDQYLALERLNDKNAKYLSTEEVENALGL